MNQDLKLTINVKSVQPVYLSLSIYKTFPLDLSAFMIIRLDSFSGSGVLTVKHLLSNIYHNSVQVDFTAYGLYVV